VQGQPSQGRDAREIDELDDFIIVNAGVFFDATDDFRLTFSVNNLFNRQGQKYFGELIPTSFLNAGGDQIGRRFAASARSGSDFRDSDRLGGLGIEGMAAPRGGGLSGAF
jgi:outer membrane receptor protein involved in Fe transport